MVDFRKRNGQLDAAHLFIGLACVWDDIRPPTELFEEFPHLVQFLFGFLDLIRFFVSVLAFELLAQGTEQLPRASPDPPQCRLLLGGILYLRHRLLDLLGDGFRVADQCLELSVHRGAGGCWGGGWLRRWPPS